jgi:hypothetical protein
VKCLSYKAVYNWIEKLKVADGETEVQKWLIQQSKNFYVASFNALVKQWGKCIDVGG